MENKKPSAGRRILNTVLLLLNLAMLVWIIVSWREEQKPQSAVDYYRKQGYDVSIFENTNDGGAVRP